jgi:hypothetical protein
VILLPYMVLNKDIQILEHTLEETLLNCLEGVVSILLEGVAIIILIEGILRSIAGLLDIQVFH